MFKHNVFDKAFNFSVNMFSFLYDISPLKELSIYTGVVIRNEFIASRKYFFEPNNSKKNFVFSNTSSNVKLNNGS